jgi:glutathione S-transferase
MQAMATNKAALITAVKRFELRLADNAYLAGSALSLADIVIMADLRAAFEKVCALPVPSSDALAILYAVLRPVA